MSDRGDWCEASGFLDRKGACRNPDGCVCDKIADMKAKRTRQEERVRVLEEALWPFASYLDLAAFDLDNSGNPLPDDQGMGWTYLTVGDFRRARAALGNGGGDA